MLEKKYWNYWKYRYLKYTCTGNTQLFEVFQVLFTWNTCTWSTKQVPIYLKYRPTLLHSILHFLLFSTLSYFFRTPRHARFTFLISLSSCSVLIFYFYILLYTVSSACSPAYPRSHFVPFCFLPYHVSSHSPVYS